MLVVEGEPGIGKTALLAVAAERARERGLRVCRARATPPEREYGFGVVRQLLDPVVARAEPDERERLFGGAAAQARNVVPGAAGAAPEATLDQGFAVMQALFWVVVNLAGTQPLALVVDDAHWADAASLRFLHFLAPRLEGLPLLALVATRPPSDFAAAMLRPAALSPAGTRSVLAGALTEPPSDAIAAAVHKRCAGNPFLIRSLAREVSDGTDVGKLPAAGARAIATAAERRLRALPPTCQSLTRALVVLGDGCRLADAAVLAGLDHEAAGEAFDALVDDGIVLDEPPRFAHPVVAEALYSRLPPARRARLHAKAARILARAGAEPGRVAAHLLATPPADDEWTVAQLRGAAVAAVMAGDPDGAVGLLRRARAEPPPMPERAAVELELGIAMARAGDPAALGLLADVAATAPDQAQRVIAALAWARLQVFRGDLDAAVAGLEPVALALGEADREWAMMAEAELIDAAWSLETWPRRAAAITRLERIATPADRLWPVAMVSRAFDLAIASAPAADVEALLEPVLRGDRLLHAVSADAPILYLAINALGLIGRYDRAMPLLEQALADARARGSRPAVAYLSAYRAVLELRGGSVARAAADAATAHEFVIEYHFAVGLPMVAAVLSDALLELGDVAGATVAMAQVPAADTLAGNPYLGYHLAGLGRLREALGDHDGAAARWRAAAVAMRARGWDTPELVPWRSALAALGDRDATALAQKEQELARRIGSGRGIAIALQGAAACAASADERIAALRAALAAVAGGPVRIEAARSGLALGRALVAKGDAAAAREVLQQALDDAAHCEGRALAASIRQALRDAGARPRRAHATGPDALTAAERRVADLAARGATNRAIAEALFVTVKTVEGHLSGAFRKLGVHTRHELVAVLRP